MIAIVDTITPVLFRYTSRQHVVKRGFWRSAQIYKVAADEGDAHAIRCLVVLRGVVDGGVND